MPARPTAAVRRRIEDLVAQRQVTRVQKEVDGLGESVDGTAQELQANLHLYRPSKNSEFETAGQQTSGNLMGICLPDENVKVGDVVNYGSESFTIDSKLAKPDKDEPIYYRLELSLVE